MCRSSPRFQGLLLLTAFLFVVINFIVDILYFLIDPRLRVERA